MNAQMISQNFQIINTQLARLAKAVDVGLERRIRVLEAQVAELEGMIARLYRNADSVGVVASTEVKRGPGRPRKDHSEGATT